MSKFRKIMMSIGGFSALSGQGTFPLTDSSDIKGVPGENLNKELYVFWRIPAKANCKLLVFIHGWDGGGDYDPGSTVIDYLHSNNIAYMSVGMRGRNTGPAPDYANDSNPPSSGDVEKYRDASGIEVLDIAKSVDYITQYVASAGQINLDKIWLYGTSAGGGNAVASAAKYPNKYAGIVDFFGMSKYGAYPGDPNIAFEGWALTDVGFQGAIYFATGGPSYNGIGYTTGINDILYTGRDHLRALADFQGKFHMYHYTGDGFVDVQHSDELEDVLIANGQSYSYHRSASASLYNHGDFDLLTAKFDPITPYGLHWVADMESISRVPSANSGTTVVAGFKVFDNWEIWNKRFRNNSSHVSVPAGYRYNQGRHSMCFVTYDLDTNEFTLTPIYPTSPTEPYSFINIVKDGLSSDYLVASGDTVTVKPQLFAKASAGISGYDSNFFFNLGDTDGYVLDDAGKVSNIINLCGPAYNIAWQETRATRKAITSGGLLNPIYKLRGTSGTLANGVTSLTLTGAFSLIVKVNAATVGAGKNIMGRGTSFLYIDAQFSGKFQMAIQLSGTNLTNGASHSNTEVGTGLIVIGIRRDASNNIYMYTKSAAGLFSYGNRGTTANAFDFGSLGGVAAANQFDGTIYRARDYKADIGDANMQAILNDWYAA